MFYHVANKELVVAPPKLTWKYIVFTHQEEVAV